MTDVYFDSHVSHDSAVFDWVAGIDWLYGNGRQRSANFEYAVLPDGSNAPRSSSLNIDKLTVLNDRRSFGGIYAQTVVRPSSALTLLAGLRLNRTAEKRCGGEGQGSEILTRTSVSIDKGSASLVRWGRATPCGIQARTQLSRSPTTAIPTSPRRSTSVPKLSPTSSSLRRQAAGKPVSRPMLSAGGYTPKPVTSTRASKTW